MKPVYSKTKGSSAAASTVFSSQYQASEQTEDSLGTGDGSTVTFNLVAGSIVPWRVGTVQICVDGVKVADDTTTASTSTTGTITGGTGATLVTGTVVYATGVVAVTFATAPASGADISALYLFNSESNTTDIGGVDIVFSTFQVKARKHPLQLKWSVDAALVTQGSLNFDVEDVLSLAAAQEFLQVA